MRKLIRCVYTWQEIFAGVCAAEGCRVTSQRRSLSAGSDVGNGDDTHNISAAHTVSSEGEYCPARASNVNYNGELRRLCV